MQVRIDPNKNRDRMAPPMSQMGSYVQFRMAMPRPSNEEVHVRHILRFYVARSFVKSGYKNVMILPTVDVDGQQLTVDVAGQKGDKYILAICEPGAVSKETLSKLDTLKDVDNAEVIILYSAHANAGDVPQRFKDQLTTRQFRLSSVVPPPFDDAMEYDIWMFEITFQEVLA